MRISLLEQRELKALMHEALLNPDELPLSGASPAEIAAAEAKLGRRLPEELRDWLSVVNGACIGRQYFIGVHPASYDIESTLEGTPYWEGRGWLPIAGDGCGDYYVLLEDEIGHPIAFIDQMDFEKLAYVVSSNLAIFLRRFIAAEAILDWGWLFDKSEMLEKDPALLTLNVAPLPWEE